MRKDSGLRIKEKGGGGGVDFKYNFLSSKFKYSIKKSRREKSAPESSKTQPENPELEVKLESKHQTRVIPPATKKARLEE